MIVEFFVPGKRIATAGSKTAFKTASGQMVYRHASKFTKPWMDKVSYFATKAYPRGIIHTEPLGMIIWFQMPRPQGHYGTGKNEGILKEWAKEKRPTGKPDLSKCVRAIEDALTGIVWKDDSQLVWILPNKRYADKTGAYIEIMTADEFEEKLSRGITLEDLKFGDMKND